MADLIKPFPVVCLADVEEKETQWLWNPYIPRGGLTMLIGDGGYGKSSLTCSIAADLSAGRPLPGQGPLSPMNILMLNAEDGLAELIKKKLRLLDADMNHIYGYEEDFKLGSPDFHRMIATMAEVDATVVFLDPLVVYMGGEVDINRSNETRAITKLLAKTAKETNTAIVVIHHVRKQQGGPGQHKTMGSADLVNSSRSTLLVDISKAGQYYMAHVKSNWAAKGPSLAYDFTGDSFHWGGEYSGEDDGIEVSTTPRGKAKEFLFDLLSQGPVPALIVMEKAIEAGLNERTLNRAKKGFVQSIRKDGNWYWELIDRAGLDGYVPPLPPLTVEQKLATVPVDLDPAPALDPKVQAILNRVKGKNNG